MLGPRHKLLMPTRVLKSDQPVVCHCILSHGLLHYHRDFSLYRGLLNKGCPHESPIRALPRGTLARHSRPRRPAKPSTGKRGRQADRKSRELALRHRCEPSGCGRRAPQTTPVRPVHPRCCGHGKRAPPNEATRPPVAPRLAGRPAHTSMSSQRCIQTAIIAACPPAEEVSVGELALCGIALSAGAGHR